MENYCPHCDCLTKTIVYPVKISHTFFKKDYQAMGEKAYCANCRQEINSEKYDEKNMLILRDIYKKENGLILNSEIYHLLGIYGLTIVDLGLILNWGYVTLNRYLSNRVFPKMIYSQMLYGLGNVAYYKALLEEKKHLLKENRYNFYMLKVSQLENNNIKNIFNISEQELATQEEHLRTSKKNILPEKKVVAKPFKTFINIENAKQLEKLIATAFNTPLDQITGLGSYKHLQWHPLTAATLLITPLYFNNIIPTLDFFDKELMMYRVLLTPPQEKPVEQNTIDNYIELLERIVQDYYSHLKRHNNETDCKKDLKNDSQPINNETSQSAKEPMHKKIPEIQKLSQTDDDIEIMDFSEYASNCIIPFIAIYDHPKDYPDCYVARLYDVDKATPYIAKSKDCEEVLKTIPKTFRNIGRHPEDDEKIKEVWL